MDNLNLEKDIEKKENQDNASVLNSGSSSSFSLEKVKTGKNKKVFSFAILTVAAIVLLLIAGYLVDKYTSINLLGGSPEAVVNKQFSAVFLSNGQVYFGTIEDEEDDYTILKNIYYLQVASPLQQVPPNSAQQQPQLVLVKLGSELHGPADYMKINNRHIIFIEELKSDGKVMDAIRRYKTTDQNQPTTQNQLQSNNNQQPAQQSAQ